MRNLQNPWKQAELVAQKGKKRVTCPVLLNENIAAKHERPKQSEERIKP